MEKREVNLKDIEIRDSFWSARQKLVSEVVIPYQEKILKDEIPGIEKSHAIANFRIAAGMEEGEFYGMVFQDSDLAKWLEGVAYSLNTMPDKALEERADEIIEIIAAAQQPDGYLDTYFIVKEPDRKFENLQECHELYCAGHMMEAAVAYYEATGKDKLLRVMQREADCIRHHIGAEEGKIHGVPGHEEIEIGLLRMYQATGRDEDLELAEYFLNERGKNPNYFAEETTKRGWIQWENSPHDTEYNQSYAPVREQKEARGHSVRAMYLYTAMAEYTRIKNDSSMEEACRRLWKNVTQRQMYLTGGIGQAAKWEGFTFDYDLPNDTAYAETCASIGLVMFARRMLALEKNGIYADVMERALYNGILSGMQLDGKRFFYVNPLEVIPGVSGRLPGYEHALTQRPEWFPCACCPPNVVRLIASLGRYVWEEENDVAYAHLFVGGSARLSMATLVVDSKLPWEGEVCYRLQECRREQFTLAIHIPEYLKNFELSINGRKVNAADVRIEKGYLYLSRCWKVGDEVKLTAALMVRRVYANPMVRADAGCVALIRGPIVYCVEGTDNAGKLSALRIPRDAGITAIAAPKGLPEEIRALSIEGCRDAFEDGTLYAEEPPKEAKTTITAIPYYAWGNRGENEMRVWMRE